MHSIDPNRCKLPEGRYVILGDLQNNYDVLAALAGVDATPLFIGDYVDSRRYSRKQQFNGLISVLDMVEHGALALFGNHEMSYLGPEHMRASGYAGTMRALMMPYMSRARNLLLPFLYHERTRTLFTHAGVSKPVWDEYCFTFEDLEAILWDASRDSESFFYAIGAARSGKSLCGGPLWCDWDMEFDSVPGLTQVVGHSSYDPTGPLLRENDDTIGCIRVRGTDLNVDCLGSSAHAVIFDTADGSFTGIELT